MRKMSYAAVLLMLIAGCSMRDTKSIPQKQHTSERVETTSPVQDVDTACIVQDVDTACTYRFGKASKTEPVIEGECSLWTDVDFSPEEIAKWDEMNADGGFYMVRGAERYLDTIVNHIHIVFITEP